MTAKHALAVRDFPAPSYLATYLHIYLKVQMPQNSSAATANSQPLMLPVLDSTLTVCNAVVYIKNIFHDS